jgi:uncharacterized protein involved in exopolysaccharide biosynthesis
VSLLELAEPLARRWKLVLGIPAVLGLVAGLVSAILPSVYSAQTTLTPVASSSIGGLGVSALASLAGLAGQLGVSTGAGGTISPDFIAQVLKSREVLTATVESRFRSGNEERPLLDILGVEGRSPAVRLSRGIRKLEKSVRTRVDHATGIVTLMVQAKDPVLAADIANRMRVILNSFNLERRQSQSREQARFTRERLSEAEAELRAAEAAQLRFLQANREYLGSPVLEFEAGRLQRIVDLKQEVYVSLAKAYDEARISEVRDTPVITTIDSAVAPDRPSGPKLVLNVVIGVLIGGILAFILVFLLERRARPAPSRQQVARGRDPAHSGLGQPGTGI